MTIPERHLWSILRRNRLGLHFRRQHPVGPYVLDFYCDAARLCIEVDGPTHDHTQVRDAWRDAWLLARRIRTLRFSAEAVLRPEEHTPMLDAIAAAAAPSTSFAGPPPPASPGEDRTENSRPGVLSRSAGEGDHAQHGGGSTSPRMNTRNDN